MGVRAEVRKIGGMTIGVWILIAALASISVVLISGFFIRPQPMDGLHEILEASEERNRDLQIKLVRMEREKHDMEKSRDYWYDKYRNLVLRRDEIEK